MHLEWSHPTIRGLGVTASLSEPARALACNLSTPTQLLDHLLAHRLDYDAFRLLAYGLPKCRAVWWGCLCLRVTSLERPLPPAEEDALHAAAHWAMEASESSRRQAEKPANAATLDTPAGMLAMAAVWAVEHGASKKSRTPRAVASAVQVAAARVVRNHRETTRGQFLALGVQVLQGQAHWEKESIS